MDKIQYDVVVVGGGPGGYAAAFHAAENGFKTLLVDQDPRLGGVCLNRGCIPSKALLHVTKFIDEAKESGELRGVEFAQPKINLNKLRSWKNAVIEKLASGIQTLAKAKKCEYMNGRGYFESSDILRVETKSGQKFIQFKKAIIAVGSKPAIPSAFDLGNPRIMTSTEALELEEIPQKLLIVGGGYIGMELGTVYAVLGSEITVMEALPQILTGADADLTRPVIQKAKKLFKDIRLGVKVKSMATAGKKIKVTSEADGKPVEELYDRVLISVGRRPNSENLGIQNTKVQLDEKGFIRVNAQQETSDPNIYAIGDIAGGIMLAHKASKEAKIAVEAILGHSVAFENIIIPAVVFTDPEVAWAGLTENEAKQKNIPIQVAKFPWGASGRAISFDRTDGLTKLIVEPETERILGVGIVGANAGDLISEGVHAIEMGSTVHDLAETVHPHPTLSETLMEAAEVFYGTSAHAVSKSQRS